MNSKPLILIGMAAMVIAWRLLAYWAPHPAISDPPVVSLWFSVLGFWYLGWTAWAYYRHAGPGHCLAISIRHGDGRPLGRSDSP